MTVLSTRLFKPITNEGFLKRDRLISLLEKNYYKPLTLVVAAAGYGKSVVVSQWLDEHKSAHCWISLEQDCNELRLYLGYLATSIKTVYPNHLPQFTDLLNALLLPPVKEIAKMLINELNDLPDDLRIVLDDYYHIKNRVIHEFMDELLRSAPRKVSFIIITRHDPPINLSLLKAYERTTEVRMADLRFTEEEISVYAHNYYAESITDDTAKSIAQVSEGWILGIRLMLKEIRDGKNILESLENLQGEKNILSGFLIEEVFSGLSGFVKKGLMLTSLFDRFNFNMLEKVSVPITEEQNSENVQIRIEMENFINSSMFIIPLDINHEWFRFHHLVQNFLYSQIKKAYSQELINQVYLEASDYFVSKGNLEEGIKYSVRGEDLPRAIQIITEHSDDLLLRDQFGRIERWIGMLPAGTPESYPYLLAIRARINESHVNYVDMKRNLDNLKDKLELLDNQEKASKKLWGQYHALRAGYYYYTGKIDLILEHADKALELLSYRFSYFYEHAILFKSFALQLSNKCKEAIDLFKDYMINIPPDYRLGLMRSHSFILLIYTYQADIEAIKSSAKLALQISKEENASVALVMTSYYLGSIHYFQNEFDHVEAYIKSVSDHRFAGRPMWVAHGLFFGVLYYLSLGRIEEMEQATEDLISYLKSFNDNNFDDLAYSFRVELALRRNNLSQAEEYALKTRYNSIPIIWNFHFMQLTEVKLLIKKGDPDSMNRAKKLLKEYVELGTAHQNTNFLLQVYTLLAIWHYKTNQFDEAVHFLSEALTIGRPGRYIRMFADYGEEMKEILFLLPEYNRSDPFVIELFSVIEEDKSRNNKYEITKRTEEGMKNLIYLLTPREIEILKLVSRGYQNKEIADKLCVSSETVKKYLYYAYNKLGVKNRTSAVSKAVNLHLIPSVADQT